MDWFKENLKNTFEKFPWGFCGHHSHPELSLCVKPGLTLWSTCLLGLGSTLGHKLLRNIYWSSHEHLNRWEKMWFWIILKAWGRFEICWITRINHLASWSLCWSPTIFIPSCMTSMTIAWAARERYQNWHQIILN